MQTSFMTKVSSTLIAIGIGLVITASPVAAQSSAASLEFSPKEITVKHQDIFKTQVIVDTAGRPAAGVGAQIVYDKFVLEVLDIEIGTIFADYPVAAFDNETGMIHISGIVSGPDENFLGRSTFATITWKLLKPEETSPFFIFKPGATDDSNIAVTTGNGDILALAGPLIVTPGSVTSVPASEGLDPQQIQAATLSDEGDEQGFLGKLWLEVKLWGNNVLKKLRFRASTVQGESVVDPYAPIGSLEPKTSFQREQAEGDVSEPGGVATELKTRGQPIVVYAAGAFILALLAFFLWRRFRRAPVEASPYRPPEMPQQQPTDFPQYPPTNTPQV